MLLVPAIASPSPTPLLKELDLFELLKPLRKKLNRSVGILSNSAGVAVMITHRELPMLEQYNLIAEEPESCLSSMMPRGLMKSEQLVVPELP